MNTIETGLRTGDNFMRSVLIKKCSLFIQTAIVFTVAVCFAACTQSEVKKEKESSPAVDYEAKRLLAYNNTVYPSAIAAIKSGDIITRLGTDITSEMIRQLNQKDKSFSHCGIAGIEHDTIFVYHAIGGEFNPNQKLKREPLYTFCHPSENKSLGVFEISMDANSKKKLQTIIQDCYKNGTLFDMDFDYSTDDKLYCAEFVSKSISRAIGDSTWFAFSTSKSFKYVAVDNLINNKLAKKILQSNY